MNNIKNESEIQTTKKARKKNLIDARAKRIIDYSSDLNYLFNDIGAKCKIIDKKFSNRYSQYVLNCETKKDFDKVMANVNVIALITESYNGVRVIKNKLNIILEITNKEKGECRLLNVLKNKGNKDLPLLLGEDVNGNCIKSSFQEIPHLLIGGSTGSGKSVYIKSLISYIISNYNSNEIKFLLIDPKNIEYNLFQKSPYVLENKIFSDNKEVLKVLQRIKEEINKRESLFCVNKTKNIDEYNNLRDINKLYKIVVVIDEFADFIYEEKEKFEEYIEFITKKGLEYGVYLILSTQRVYELTITDKIKKCFKNILAFNLCSGEDSKLLINSDDAKYLIGYGDFLFKDQKNNLKRLLAYNVSDEEIENIIYKKENF